MKLKNEIYTNGFTGALTRLTRQGDLNLATSYKIAKLAKIINEHGELFYAERLKIAQKHGDEDEERKGQHNIREEELEVANEKLKALADIEENYKFKKVKLPKDIKITPADLMLLEDILIIPE